MGTTESPTTDVVVVGAGPVGLVAACELARRGIAVRVIDKLAQPTNESRAIAIHARSLDMLDRMGIIDELVATGVKSTGMKMYTRDKPLMHVPLGSVDSAFPYMLVTAQTETERVLTGRLTELGVTIERAVELTGLTQDDRAAHLTVRRADGSTEQIDATWVVGTDGAHSTVRNLLGTKLAGSFKGERFILGDVEAEHRLDNTSAYTFFSSDGPVVTLPMRGGRVRFLAQIHDAPGAPLNLSPSQEQLQQIVDKRIGGITITTAHWLTCFEIHHAQVPEYRYGRVFLAGDAAHIHSPAGGQGMNTGMQDAFNIGWKLAMVLRGEGGETLLDSYHAERYPVAKGVIDFTSMLTRVGTLKGGARVARNALVRVVGKIPAIQHMMADTLEEVTVSYQGSPAVSSSHTHTKVAAGQHFPHIDDANLQKQLSRTCGVDNPRHTVLTVATDKPAPAAGPAGQVQVLISSNDTPVGGYDTVIADPNGLVAQRLGLKHGGRIVIRPDGYIGAISPLDDTTGVADYFAQIAR
jgi:2-polyprenyl-6-methoxyphenol hydroxylase-like FAD-dependent oxidoreductase